MEVKKLYVFNDLKYAETIYRSWKEVWRVVVFCVKNAHNTVLCNKNVQMLKYLGVLTVKDI